MTVAALMRPVVEPWPGRRGALYALSLRLGWCQSPPRGSKIKERHPTVSTNTPCQYATKWRNSGPGPDMATTALSEGWRQDKGFAGTSRAAETQHEHDSSMRKTPPKHSVTHMVPLRWLVDVRGLVEPHHSRAVMKPHEK